MTIDVLSFGEDGEYLLAEGHHDLAAFMDAAKREAKSLYMDLDEDDFPAPRHRWMRPWLRSDSDTDEDFDWRQSEDWHKFTDDPSEPDAVAITVMEFDL